MPTLRLLAECARVCLGDAEALRQVLGKAQGLGVQEAERRADGRRLGQRPRGSGGHTGSPAAASPAAGNGDGRGPQEGARCSFAARVGTRSGTWSSELPN